jgi:hypothetical protein
MKGGMEGMEDHRRCGDYRSYMDRIVVDESLHSRIMSRIARSAQAQGTERAAEQTRPAERAEQALPASALQESLELQTSRAPKAEPVEREAPVPRIPLTRKTSARRFLSLRRFGVILACAAAIALAIRIVPQLVNPPQIAVPPIALVFNRVEGDTAPMEGDVSLSNRYIPGYFTQKLSEDDVAALFGDAWPRLSEDYRMSAEAGFSGEGELERVSVTCELRATGRVVSIVMAQGAVPMDVLYPEEAESTDVNGTAVTAGFWESPSDGRPTLHYASFILGETGYYIEGAGDEAARDEITAFVATIIGSGAADLGRITPDYIPEWREDDVTLAEALSDPDFGAYVPDGPPEGFVFESGRRILNQRQDYLRITWSSGLKHVTWTVRRMDQSDTARVVDVAAPETYDLSLYPIPRAESVPAGLREIVDNPIVKAEDLTTDFIRARSYTVDDAGDDNTGYRMRFSVLYGDVLVELNAKGVTQEAVGEMFEGLGEARTSIRVALSNRPMKEHPGESGAVPSQYQIRRRALEPFPLPGSLTEREWIMTIGGFDHVKAAIKSLYGDGHCRIHIVRRLEHQFRRRTDQL